MPHPCREEADGVTMHACGSKQSKVALCGVDIVDVDATAGYQKVCQTCFPRDRGKGGGDGINDRG